MTTHYDTIIVGAGLAGLTAATTYAAATDTAATDTMSADAAITQLASPEVLYLHGGWATLRAQIAEQAERAGATLLSVDEPTYFSVHSPPARLAPVRSHFLRRKRSRTGCRSQPQAVSLDVRAWRRPGWTARSLPVTGSDPTAC